MGFVSELKRRNVIRVAIAYAAVAWLVLQVADLLLDAYEAPGWIIRIITTIIIVGFPISLTLAWFFELNYDGARRDDPSDQAEVTSALSKRRFNLVIIGMLSAAVVFLVIDNYVLNRPPGDSGATPRSIAVLPFVNMSSDPEQEFFSDGIAEEILNALAKVHQLKVAGRTSSFAFKGKNEDLRLIGDTLGVAYVLEGSVRKYGDNIRVTAQLVKVADGFNMWSDSYDTTLTNIFAVQDSIAGEILRQLKTRLLDNEQKQLAATPTSSEAYNLYLLARQQIYARRQATLESAVILLDQVVAIDAEYAPAWAHRGIAELLLADGNYGEIPVAQALVNSKRYFDTALSLDPDLAEGWAGMGLYHLTRQNEYAQAIDVLKKSLLINPNLIDASQWLKNALNASGKIAEARQITEQIAARDPLFRPGFISAVLSFNRFGEQQQSFALINKVRKLLPEDPSVLWAEGVTHASLGQIAAAYPLVERAMHLAPQNAVMRYAFSEALLSTYQLERLASEGYNDLRIVGLDFIGKHTEAARQAQKLADSGMLLPLFSHYNRNAQHALLVRYVETGWNSLQAFAQAYPPNVNGYQIMSEIALAYKMTNNADRYSTALEHLAIALQVPGDLGADNAAFHYNRAVYFALTGAVDGALAALERAIEQGYRDTLPLAAAQPSFAALAADPRFTALENRMRRYFTATQKALDITPNTLN